jgi:hypothetical protein
MRPMLVRILDESAMVYDRHRVVKAVPRLSEGCNGKERTANKFKAFSKFSSSYALSALAQVSSSAFKDIGKLQFSSGLATGLKVRIIGG